MAAPLQPTQASSEQSSSGTEPQKVKEEATSTYDQCEESDLYKQAKVYLNEGKFEDALNVIEQALESNHKDLLAKGLTEDSIVLHESMAPLHYLYGTTLLYSIEESSGSQSMTQPQPTEAQEDGEEVDESQIAWENLETARTILERLVRPDSTDKLKLDLAQVYLREGDLHRMNGRYQNAIDDYESCLKFRKNSSLGAFHRKVADVHYNLGLANQLLVAESNSANSNKADEAKALSLSQFRVNSFDHLLACGKALTGEMALICGVEPQKFVHDAISSIARLKSTGDDESDRPKSAGAMLAKLRTEIRTLQPPEDKSHLFHDTMEVLDEIQEMIDESKSSEQGVREVLDLKAEISAMVASEDKATEDAVPKEAPTSTCGFGTAQAAKSTAVANTLTGVKRKRKKDDGKGSDSKQPKSE